MMKKRPGALLLCLVLLASALLTACQTPAPEPETPSAEEGFVPILRFAVTSDIHMRENEDVDFNSRENLRKFLSTAYKYTEGKSYAKLDGIFFAGDMTQSGTDKEFTDFFAIVNEMTKDETVVRAVLGNHEFYATKYDDGTNTDIRYSDTSVQNTNERFKHYGGYDTVDAHLVIGGYHFIFLSMDRYDKSQSNFFTDEKLEWLETELEKAAEDDSTGKKPIFVFQHEPPKDTMLGSGKTASDADLTKVLAKFPQVVDFSGHTHRPVTDPRSIWQDTFTALSTGSLAYLGINIAGHSSYDDSGVVALDKEGAWSTTGNLEDEIRNAGMYYIVEIDANNTVRVLTYDIFTDALWGEPLEFTVGDLREFKYTNERDFLSPKPTFAADAALVLKDNYYKKVVLEIPRASCDAVVQNYRVDVIRDGKLVTKIYRLAGTYYGAAAPTVISAPITGLLADTTYTVKVYAVSSWGKCSEPLVASFTTGSVLNTDGAPDILQTVFGESGTATNGVTGEQLTPFGTVATQYDEALGRYVGVFDGNGAFTFDDMAYWYDIIGKSLTLEAYVYLPSKPASGYTDILSNQQSGGFGFEYKSSGEMQFFCNAGETASNRLKYVVPTGEWVHLVATYDGQHQRLYVNGELVGEIATSSEVKRPVGAANYLAIGGDAGIASPQAFATCRIAAANLYSKALTAQQVAANYAAYSAK